MTIAGRRRRRRRRRRRKFMMEKVTVWVNGTRNPV
jgi:hypothetical protein